MKIAVLVGALLLVLAAPAAAARGWTARQAAAKLKATYTTTDQSAYDVVKANLDQAIAAGEPQATIDRLTSALDATKHQAKVMRATCRGSGHAVRGMFRRFHCTAAVAGTFRAPPDYKVFAATVKVTVRVPFRVTAGWR